MARSRNDLHDIFEKLLGTKNVYFQPPASVRMSYPAIRYKLSMIQVNSANNHKYKNMKKYDVVYITDNPDDLMIDRINELPYCSMSSQYCVDNLYNNFYTLYF